MLVIPSLDLAVYVTGFQFFLLIMSLAAATQAEPKLDVTPARIQ